MHPFHAHQLANERHVRLQREVELSRLVREARLVSTRRLRVRPLERTDVDGLAALYDGLSPRSRFLRFMSPMSSVPAAILDRLADIDHDGHEALGAFDHNGLVASVHWFRPDGGPETAHVAAEVADRYQRRGVGSRLLHTLARAARGRGIAMFNATMLAENVGAIELFRSTGWPIHSTVDGPELTVVTRIDPAR